MIIEPLLYLSKHKQAPIKAITYTYITIQGLNHLEPTVGFDPLIIIPESVYLNLTHANNLSHHGWIQFAEVCKAEIAEPTFLVIVHL